MARFEMIKDEIFDNETGKIVTDVLEVLNDLGEHIDVLQGEIRDEQNLNSEYRDKLSEYRDKLYEIASIADDTY